MTYEGAVVVAIGEDGPNMALAGGTGGFRGLLLGSVSAQLTAHGHCPVAVGRPAGTATTGVVVGIDGSQAGRWRSGSRRRTVSACCPRDARSPSPRPEPELTHEHRTLRAARRQTTASFL